MRKEKSRFFLDTEVPFELRERMAEMRIFCLPLEERQNNKVWYANSLEDKKTAEREIKRFEFHSTRETSSFPQANKRDIPYNPSSLTLQTLQKEDKEHTDHLMHSLLKEEPKSVAKSDSSFLVPPSFQVITKEETDWKFLFSDSGWNSLKAVEMIKTYGLPSKEEDRISLLQWLNKRFPGKQYNIVYEDLCEYCEAFEAAYGTKVIEEALRMSGIKNGFNLQAKLENSKLLEEIKKAMLFLFPIVHRERDYVNEKESITQLDEWTQEKGIEELEEEI